MIDSCVNTHLVRLSLVVGHWSLFFSNLASHLIIRGKRINITAWRYRIYVAVLI